MFMSAANKKKLGVVGAKKVEKENKKNVIH